MLVGGQLATVTTTRTEDELVVDIGQSRIVLGARDSDGQVISPLGDDTLQLEAGGEVAIRSEGFAPLSEAEGWLFSDPVNLGSERANDSGRLDAVFAIPESVEPGNHRFSLRATDTSDKPIELTLGVQVNGRADADVQWTWVLVGGVVGLGILTALFLPPALRRRPRA